ncbi:hypothetical protein ACI6QG_03670 [Roseococcus sp. DSY-14]|uniref:hypothetical protein n=1 Tax=Roseococcus sp. DSY-14 TaxID=3369650 RepID=UPI00387B4A3A
MKALRRLLGRKAAPPPGSKAAPPDGPSLPPLPAAPEPLPDPAAGDGLLAAALPLAWRRRVLLCWGDAARVARFTLACEAAGARAVQVVAPEPHGAAAALAEAAAERGLPPPRATSLPVGGARVVDAGPCWWLDGQPGPALSRFRPDLVVDGGQLVHREEPLARLRALAATGARHLVLETPVVGASGALAEAGFRPGDTWFAVSMTPAMSRAMAAWWAARAVELEQYRLFPGGFTAAQAHAAGLTGTAWWSFMDRLALVALLGQAGWRARRLETGWDGRSVVVVAERA